MLPLQQRYKFMEIWNHARNFTDFGFCCNSNIEFSVWMYCTVYRSTNSNENQHRVCQEYGITAFRIYEL